MNQRSNSMIDGLSPVNSDELANVEGGNVLAVAGLILSVASIVGEFAYRAGYEAGRCEPTK